MGTLINVDISNHLLWAKQNGISIALVNAILEGDVVFVTALLDAGADPNIIDETGKTALIYASEKGHSEIVDILLEKGAAVDTEDRTGKTALTYANYNEHFHIVEKLFRNEAMPHIRDVNDWGETLTYITNNCFYGAIVKHLISQGVPVNVPAQNGRTALMNTVVCACMSWGHDNTELVKFLIEKGANDNAYDE